MIRLVCYYCGGTIAELDGAVPSAMGIAGLSPDVCPHCGRPLRKEPAFDEAVIRVRKPSAPRRPARGRPSERRWPSLLGRFKR
ncbi:MAG: hypothetical protein ACP5I3_12175 [Thermoproteus sp.]